MAATAFNSLLLNGLPLTQSGGKLSLNNSPLASSGDAFTHLNIFSSSSEPNQSLYVQSDSTRYPWVVRIEAGRSGAVDGLNLSSLSGVSLNAYVLNPVGNIALFSSAQDRLSTIFPRLAILNNGSLQWGASPNYLYESGGRAYVNSSGLAYLSETVPSLDSTYQVYRTPQVSLTVTGGYNSLVSVPSGYSFCCDQFSFLCTAISGSNITGVGSGIFSGNCGSNLFTSFLLPSQPITGRIKNSRQVFSTQTSINHSGFYLSASITSPSNASVHSGIFIFQGSVIKV